MSGNWNWSYSIFRIKFMKVKCFVIDVIKYLWQAVLTFPLPLPISHLQVVVTGRKTFRWRQLCISWKIVYIVRKFAEYIERILKYVNIKRQDKMLIISLRKYIIIDFFGEISRNKKKLIFFWVYRNLSTKFHTAFIIDK